MRFIPTCTDVEYLSVLLALEIEGAVVPVGGACQIELAKGKGLWGRFLCLKHYYL